MRGTMVSRTHPDATTGRRSSHARRVIYRPVFEEALAAAHMELWELAARAAKLDASVEETCSPQLLALTVKRSERSPGVPKLQTPVLYRRWSRTGSA